MLKIYLSTESTSQLAKEGSQTQELLCKGQMTKALMPGYGSSTSISKSEISMKILRVKKKNEAGSRQ